MAPTSSNSNDNNTLRDLTDIQQRLTRVEQQQIALASDVERLQRTSDAQEDSIKADYVPKTIFTLQMENLNLTIALLKETVTNLTGRLSGLETNIVNEVKQVTETQRKEQMISRNRIIAAQATILLIILSALAGVVVPLLLSHSK